MPEIFHLLKDQIAEHLQDVDISSVSLTRFIQAVNETYTKFDSDHKEMERSLTLSAEELVQTNEEMYAIFQAIPDQLFHFSEDGVVISYQSGRKEHYYLTAEKLINKSIFDILRKDIAEMFLKAINEAIKNKSVINFEFVVVHEHKIYYYETRVMPIKSMQVVALIRDITERKLAEDQIAFLAYHDGLTGLPNNLLFKERLEQGLAHAERNNTMLAVLFLDLDRFKLINDSMGHDVGDQLLQATADRLIEGVRRTDSVAMNVSTSLTSSVSSASSVARLGGDEFTIMIEDAENSQTVARVASRLIDVVSKPLMLSGTEVYTSTSIGIAIYPDDGKTVDVLLKNADAAMYHAKDQGRNNFQFFTESMNQASIERMAVESNLRKAILNKELCLYYQPQVSVITGQLVGLEALLRWKHPEKGFISPAVFVPVAEETGLIMEIGEWVVKEACRQGAAWATAGFKPVQISVNLSAKQLKDERLHEMVNGILQDTGMNPRFLGVELTESAIILDPNMALQRLEKIKSLGVKLSLDDFGTGYSSLSYLKRFPIDTLKIDQAFIRDVNADHEDAALVKAIIAMAHGLGMDVVAEGVELQEQLEFLGINGCDTIQGYLFSRPVPVADIETMLSRVSL